MRARGQTEEAIKLAKEAKGCVVTSKTRPTKLDDRYNLLGCFCRYKSESFHYYWSLYQHYNKTGNFPDSKPLLGQPAKLIEIFNNFKAWELEYMEAQRKKEAKSNG